MAMFITRELTLNEKETVQWNDGVYYYQTTFQLEIARARAIGCCRLLVGDRLASNASSKLVNPQTATASQAHITALSVPPGQNTLTAFLGPLP